MNRETYRHDSAMGEMTPHTVDVLAGIKVVVHPDAGHVRKHSVRVEIAKHYEVVPLVGLLQVGPGVVDILVNPRVAVGSLGVNFPSQASNNRVDLNCINSCTGYVPQS